jgi:cytochrome b involved in lipid metabolism
MSSTKEIKESIKANQSTASRNSESDTDTSADSLKPKLGGRDHSHQKINPNHWIVHGKKFDLTPWEHKHPGGKHAISFGKGRECTALVEQYHPFSDKVW